LKAAAQELGTEPKPQLHTSLTCAKSWQAPYTTTLTYNEHPTATTPTQHTTPQYKTTTNNTAVNKTTAHKTYHLHQHHTHPQAYYSIDYNPLTTSPHNEPYNGYTATLDIPQCSSCRNS